jgi:hypothetical protein
VREISSPGARANDDLVEMRQQRVEVVDERLHLGWIGAADAIGGPVTDSGKIPADILKWLERRPDDSRAGRHADDGQQSHERRMLMNDPQRVEHRMVIGEDDAERCEHPEGPEHRSDEHLASDRTHRGGSVVPIR